MIKKILFKDFEFEAAHTLPGYDGPCKNLHGHTWKLRIGIKGVVKKDSGMILDYKTLKEIVQSKVISKLDHAYLNDIIENPTSENVVEWIVTQLSQNVGSLWVTKEREAYDPHCSYLYSVDLWETSGSCCGWRVE